MLLMLDYGILQFIPIEDIDKQKAIPLWEVEIGKTYTGSFLLMQDYGTILLAIQLFSLL